MSMNIKSSFKINAPPHQAWSLLADIERVAPCFPGAELGESLGDGMYRANFKVKLGPVALVFGGKVGFVELNKDNGLAIIKASGSDTKGRGGAQGIVRCQLTGQGAETAVSLDMSVDLSGSIAQYGRGQGMVADLTQQLVDRFAAKLETLTAPAVAAAPGAVAAAPTSDTSAASRGNELEVGGLVSGAFWRAIKRFIARLLCRAA